MTTPQIRDTQRSVKAGILIDIDEVFDLLVDMNHEIRDLQAAINTPMFGPGIEDPDF
jgi:predicted N-formylglutamate amidohydrolase